MRFSRLYTSILIAVLSIFIFTACGSTLEKPTGIEDTENKQIETNNDDELVDLDEDEKTEKNKKSDQTKKHEEEKSTVEKESNDKKETKVTKQEKDSQPSNKSNDTKSNQEKDTRSKENSNETKSSKSSNSNSNNSTSSKGTEKNQTTKSSEQKKKETKSTVTQSIVISSDEVPLSATKTEINGEETVLDVLIKVTKEKGIQMDYRGGGSSAYIEGIANVYEFDRGQGSGWMYRINGVFPDRGAGAINVQDGDVIEWLYTTDLGKDLGADLQPFRR